MGDVMSTTHTPGPWRADQLPSGDYRIIYNTTRNWLAKVYCDGESEAAKADAALIAAAPELLAKLVEIRKWMDADVCGPWDAKFITEIDALVAKATGADQ
jgi:hypothetical protein